MIEIKFKRAYFFDEELKKFSHYSEWGVRIKGSEFTSPSYNNFATYFVDYQFIGLTDKNGKEIYEGDVFKNINDHGDYIDNTYVITFESGKFGFFNHGFFDHDIETENIEIIGNIHQQK